MKKKGKPSKPCLDPAVRRRTAVTVLGAFAAAMAALVCLSVAAHAGPLTSPIDPTVKYHAMAPQRFSFALGGGYAFHNAATAASKANLPAAVKEFEVGVNGAWSASPGLAATAYAVRGLDNRTWRSAIGGRATVWKEGGSANSSAKSLSIGAAYAFHSGEPSRLPTFSKEFEVGAFGGIALAPDWLVTAYSVYGLDNKTIRSALGLRWVVM